MTAGFVNHCSLCETEKKAESRMTQLCKIPSRPPHHPNPIPVYACLVHDSGIDRPDAGPIQTREHAEKVQGYTNDPFPTLYTR